MALPQTTSMFNKQNVLRCVTVLTVILVFILILPRISIMLKQFIAWSSTKGSHITFISLTGAMLLWACLPLPGFMFLCFGAGLLYGFVGGFFLAWTVSLVGIAISFPLYRYCCGKKLLAYLGGSSDRMKILLEEAKINGFTIALLVKMLPFTGGPANVIFAVCTPIPLLTFLGACSVAHLKYLLYTFVGSAAHSLSESGKKKNLNKVEQERSRVTNLITTILIVGSLLLMMIFGYKLLNDIEKKVQEKRARQNGNNVDVDIEVEEKKGLLDDSDSI